MNKVLIIAEEKLQLEEKLFNRVDSFEKKKKDFMERTKKLRLLINTYQREIQLKQLELDKAILKEFGRGRSFTCYDKILQDRKKKIGKSEKEVITNNDY